MTPSETPPPLTSIRSRRNTRRSIADALIKAYRAIGPSSSSPKAAPESSPCTIRIVCVSDTHSKQPSIPAGDVLIHAGDLTENGSFDEVQDGLTWLSSQPHRYKIFVAGNHDVLLDDAFLGRHPERRYGQSRTREDLDWGSVIYLQDSTATLDFTCTHHCPEGTRRLTIFGSPWTPQYGVSAFQYRPDNSQHWDDILASIDSKPHMVVTHGPPHLHLDKRDFHRAGCPFLAEAIHRIRPRLGVFGHIHAAYGREDVVLDSAQRAYEQVMKGWASWGSLVWIAVMIVWAGARRVVAPGGAKVTTFVNAAAVGGLDNELKNDPIVVDI